jgi:hypothetical protein
VSHVLITQEELWRTPGVTLADYRDACWFADLWAAHCHPGMHLRGIHYKLVSLGTVTMAKGIRPHKGRGRPAYDPVLDEICLPYVNSAWCWWWLQHSSEVARYWRLVDARDFEEHRSPEADVNAEARAAPTPDVVLPLEWPEEGFPEPVVLGYDYATADQPLTLEVWSEKSTMDDILAPLCRDLHVNYQPLAGMFSITRAVEMLCRLSKPAVVLYISDLDPAGCNMPTAFADALRHYGPLYAPGVDIRLKQLGLTEAQVVAYGLPRNVISKFDETPYNKRFRAEHPLGPCELDALEAIHPGELRRLVREAVEPYSDKTFYRRLRRAERDAEDLVAAHWHAQSAEARAELDRLEDGLMEIHSRLNDELAPLEAQMAAIRARYAEELAPLEDQRDAVRQGVLEQAIEIELPPRPEPEVLVTEDDWLAAVIGEELS